MEDQWIYNALFRLTWQMTPKNKLTAYYDRYPKFKGHEMGALTDPETAAARRDWRHAIYYTGQVKYTSTVTSRLLLEAGYSTNIEYLWHRLPAGRSEGARHRRSGSPRSARTRSSRRAWRSILARARSTPNWNGRTTPANGDRSEEVRALDVGVVRDRLAQLQGRVPVGLRQLRARIRHQRRPRAAVPQRRAVPGARLQHAGTGPRSS